MKNDIMCSNITALMQYWNTALSATSVLRAGCSLSLQTGYHQHARLETWQNLCSLCWLPCSLVGKHQPFHRTRKKVLLGRSAILIFLIEHRKLIPKQQRMNLQRELAHKQLMSELQLGLDQALNFASINKCSHSFQSVTNQWHILLTSSGFSMQTSTYMSQYWHIKAQKHYQKLCSSL